MEQIESISRPGRLAAGMLTRLLLGILVAAAIGMAVGCGGDTRNPLLPVGPATAQPPTAAEIEPTATQRAQPTSHPSATVVPTSTPAPTPTVAPTPEPTSTPQPTVQPTATAVSPGPSAASDTTPTEQTHGCATDGSLTDPRLVLSCSTDAMSQIRSVTVDVNFDLGALLPGALPAGAEIPSIRMQVARVFPDDASVTMTGPDGELVQLILVGGNTFVYDSASDLWVKMPQPQEEAASLLFSLDMIEQQVQDIDNQEIVWNELSLSEDGSQYIVSYVPPADETVIQLPPAELELSVDIETFLQNSVVLAIVDPEGAKHRVAEFRYSGHDELLVIEPPTDYIEADAAQVTPPNSGAPGGFQEEAFVVSMSKNSAGDIKVTFSEPVTLVGEIGLFVLDPATGGWSLPYLSGDGTDTLTFSAVSPDNPPLIPGKSQIVGFAYGSGDSDILDIEGQRADQYFAEWIYPE